MQNKPNLRKAQMNVSAVLTKDYENKPIGNLAKTNPIQTQYKANTNPISEKPKMKLNFYLTKDYENETAFRLHPRRGKQTQSNPIFKNSG